MCAGYAETIARLESELESSRSSLVKRGSSHRPYSRVKELETEMTAAAARAAARIAELERQLAAFTEHRGAAAGGTVLDGVVEEAELVTRLESARVETYEVCEPPLFLRVTSHFSFAIESTH